MIVADTGLRGLLVGMLLVVDTHVQDMHSAP